MKNNVIEFPRYQFRFNSKGVFVIIIAAFKEFPTQKSRGIVYKFCDLISDRANIKDSRSVFEKIKNMNVEEVKKWTDDIYGTYITNNDIDKVLNFI